MISQSPRRPGLELWAGTECTVNRVGDCYHDQLELTGHDARPEDLDRFAELGIEAFRFPLLWERTAPHGLDSADWSWADDRLGRLRELGVRPIVGLVHHGSGPPSTGLLAASFAPGLAAFAAAAAERYPWVTDWTPVNEPLTTARFSCLYGHWYPHARDDLSFLTALVNQCRATVLAMDAIRSVVPGARLLQTEDLGKTHSTAALDYQADHENERRWLSLDLLCGRVGPAHPLWPWLVRTGVDLDTLAWLARHPCPPDVVGVNHYLSSERFIDERIERYPQDSHGGNGVHEYADVLAARVLGSGPDGPETLLREVWDRYGLPLAVTEAHNGCTREEQLRWLDEVWTAAATASGKGVEVLAVTLWSLLGAVGWSDLARGGRRYEPGVFDLRSARPRATAIASMARALGEGRAYDHPVLRSPGWWRRPERLWYPAVGECLDDRSVDDAQPILITGARGTLGQAFARVCELRGLSHRLLTRQELDIADSSSVERALDHHRPWAIVNAAGYVRVDEAEADPDRCRRENADGPATLAAAGARHDLPLVTFSSDLVFDGCKDDAYVEPDAVGPLGVYGRSKAEGEVRVLDAHSAALIIRTSAFFGPWDEHNFVTIALRELAAGRSFPAADDAVVSPTYVPDLVHAALDLLIDGEVGLWHVANHGGVTWFELAREAARAQGLGGERVVACSTSSLGLAAPRPRYGVLGSGKAMLLPALDDALQRYVGETTSAGSADAEDFVRATHPGQAGLHPAGNRVDATA